MQLLAVIWMAMVTLAEASRMDTIFDETLRYYEQRFVIKSERETDTTYAAIYEAWASLCRGLARRQFDWRDTISQLDAASMNLRAQQEVEDLLTHNFLQATANGAVLDVVVTWSLRYRHAYYMLELVMSSALDELLPLMACLEVLVAYFEKIDVDALSTNARIFWTVTYKHIKEIHDGYTRVLHTSSTDDSSYVLSEESPLTDSESSFVHGSTYDDSQYPGESSQYSDYPSLQAESAEIDELNNKNVNEIVVAALEGAIGKMRSWRRSHRQMRTFLRTLTRVDWKTLVADLDTMTWSERKRVYDIFWERRSPQNTPTSFLVQKIHALGRLAASKPFDAAVLLCRFLQTLQYMQALSVHHKGGRFAPASLRFLRRMQRDLDDIVTSVLAEL